MKELKEFFDIDFTDVSIYKNFSNVFDIEVILLGNESIRFFVYPETESFRLLWYGSELETNDSAKILYLQAVSKIATTLNNKENLLSLIKILRSIKCN